MKIGNIAASYKKFALACLAVWVVVCGVLLVKTLVLALQVPPATSEIERQKAEKASNACICSKPVISGNSFDLFLHEGCKQAPAKSEPNTEALDSQDRAKEIRTVPTPECQRSDKLWEPIRARLEWEREKERIPALFLKSVAILLIALGAPFLLRGVGHLLRFCKMRLLAFISGLNTKEERAAFVSGCVGIFLILLGAAFALQNAGAFEWAILFGGGGIIAALILWTGVALLVRAILVICTRYRDWLNPPDDKV